MLAVDISVYTGKVTDAQMQAIKGAGYELVIIGLWHGQSKNPYAEQQIQAAVRADLLDGYYVLIAPPSWTPLSPQAQVMSGTLATIDLDVYPLRFLAVDAEVDITPDMLLEALIEAKSWGKTCIYTGAWWWNWFILRYHDWFYKHPNAFAEEPSWLADYDYSPVLDTKQLAHLGPVIGKQFKGTTYEVGGINADLNVFDPAFVEEEVEVAYVPPLYQIEGTTTVYELVGDTLYHLENPETYVKDKGLSWEWIQQRPADDKLWRRRVVYPLGVPDPMKRV